VHLASFLRTAPEPQKQEFWQKIGQVVSAKVGKRPLWLSTAGMGVAWLHARLDSRPKYYGYLTYVE